MACLKWTDFRVNIMSVIICKNILVYNFMDALDIGQTVYTHKWDQKRRLLQNVNTLSQCNRSNHLYDPGAY